MHLNIYINKILFFHLILLTHSGLFSLSFLSQTLRMYLKRETAFLPILPLVVHLTHLLEAIFMMYSASQIVILHFHLSFASLVGVQMHIAWSRSRPTCQ
jgi:hypothetical protein